MRAQNDGGCEAGPAHRAGDEEIGFGVLGRLPRDSKEEASISRLEWRLFFEPSLLAKAQGALLRAAARGRRPMLIALLGLFAIATVSAREAQQSGDAKLTRGEAVSLDAHAAGSPDPAITWHQRQMTGGPEHCPILDGCE